MHRVRTESRRRHRQHLAPQLLGKLGSRLQVIIVVGKVGHYDRHGQVDDHHTRNRAHSAEDHAERRLGTIVAKAYRGDRGDRKPDGLDYREELVLTALVARLGDRAAHAIAAIIAGGQLFCIEYQRGEYDHRHNDKKHQQPQYASTCLQTCHYYFKAWIVVEKLE